MTTLNELMATAFLVISQRCSLLFKSCYQIYVLQRPLQLFFIKMLSLSNPACAFISSPNGHMEKKGNFSLLKAYSYIYVSDHCGV